MKVLSWIRLRFMRIDIGRGVLIDDFIVERKLEEGLR